MEGILKMDVYLIYLAFMSFMFNLYSWNGIVISNKIFFILFPSLIIFKNLRIFFKCIKIFSILFLFFFINILNTVCAEYKIISFVFSINYLCQILFLISIVIISYKNVLNYLRIFKFLSLFAGFVSILGILQFIFYPKLEKILLILKTTSYMGQRATAIFNNPNLMASFLVGAIIITVYILLCSKNKKLHIINVCLQLIALLLTKSRAGILILVVISIFYTILNIKRYKFLKITAVIVFLIIIIYIISISNIYFLERLTSVFEFIKNKDFDRLTSKRNIIYKIAFQIFLEKNNMFLGIGNGNFEKIIGNYIGMVFGTHSLYINLLVENGIFGALICIYFGIRTFMLRKYIYCTKLRKLFSYTYIGLLLTQVTEMHLTHNFYFIYIFWVIISIPYVFYLKFLERRKNESIKNIIFSNVLDNRI